MDFIPLCSIGDELVRTMSSFNEEPDSLANVEQRPSSGSSLNNISVCHRVGDASYGEHQLHHNSNSKDSGVVESSDTGVRRRIDELQQQRISHSPSKQHFPPLSMIPQLCQQNAEPTYAWLERLEYKLKQYMDPSGTEYDVIMRWITSCGSKVEAISSEASLQMPVRNIEDRLNSQSDNNNIDGFSSIGGLQEDNKIFNSNRSNLFTIHAGKQ